jgi:hypothetical protein
MSRVSGRIQAESQIHGSLIRRQKDFAVDHSGDEGFTKGVRADGEGHGGSAANKPLATG